MSDKPARQDGAQIAPVEDIAKNCNWLTTGDQVFPAMLDAIEKARESILLESYIYSAEGIGLRMRDAMVSAALRGVRVKVLVDGLGSFKLPNAFWDPLRAAGGEARVFNPAAINRLGLRSHRKLLVCDETVGFVGGFNVAPEYEGDGVTCGWCDLGLRVQGPIVKELAQSFQLMFQRAEFKHKRFAKLRRSETRMVLGSGNEQLLLSGPGRGHNPFQQALNRDLSKARSVQMIVAYFLPTWRVRRQMRNVVRRGGKVELILGGKSDVAVSLLAAQSLYRRLLRSGIDLHEYQPQILHAKLFIIDNAVYVGSANLDPRSLRINYELMIRFENPEIARQAREVFENVRSNCKVITADHWRRNRSWWKRLKQHWAYFLLVRIDPYIASRQWQALPD